MTAPLDPRFDALMVGLIGMVGKLAGRDAQAIRERVQRLARILGERGPEGELRARAAGELEALVEAIAGLVGAAPGPAAQAVRGIDLAQLAAGLRTFAEYLRAPTGENQAEVAQLVASLQGAAPPRPLPIPLDELKIDGTVEALAVESARRHGLDGAELRRAVDRMKRQMSGLVRQLERRAHDEAARARAASDFERRIAAVIQTGGPLGQALAAESAAVIQAFRTVDLAHMAEGQQAFALWLSTPAPDAAAHVAALRARLAEVLGPPTAGDPARSEDERRADFEREIRVAVDEIFRSTDAS
jgi:hypothetical protein